MRLTKRIIDLTPCPTTGETWLADDTVPGFGVRLRNGKKTYSVRYRTLSGTLHRTSFGYTSILTLDQARTQARQLLAAVEQGEDPAQQRQADRASPTVTQLAERYLSEHVTIRNKPETQRKVTAILRLHILPALGRLRVNAVTRQPVAALLHTLHTTPAQANFCQAILSKMFSLAEQWGLREPHTNPTYQLERYREQSRERYLSGEELARLSAVFEAALAQQTEQPGTIAALRLLLLTGARVSEIVGLKWDYIQESRGIALLPDSKTGRKTLYLSSYALQILASLEHTSIYIFPASRVKGPLSPRVLRHAWHRLRKEAELEDVKIHDLRHTFASTLVMAGVSLPLVGRLLGHSSPEMTQRYSHFADDPVRQAAELAGEMLGSAYDLKLGESVSPSK